MFEAMLYEHEDGRQAVSFNVPAPFCHNEPKWHRVGPVRVYGTVAPLPSAEVEQALRAVHLSHKLGPSYDWEDLHLAFETGAALAATPPQAEHRPSVESLNLALHTLDYGKDMADAFQTKFCPYRGNPDPWVVWRAAWAACLESRAAAPQPAEHPDALDAEKWRTLIDLPGARKRIWNHVLDSQQKANHFDLEAVLAAIAASAPAGGGAK